MYPALVLVTGVAQIALLYWRSPWAEGAWAATGVLVILLLFAVTRLRWSAHLDMHLLMLGPGGLGMLLGGWGAGPACHNATWTSFGLMSLGMLLPSAPLCWWFARCILDARRRGWGWQALCADMAGMQLGMLAGHGPALLFSVTDPRLVWLHQGLMLAGMALGMMVASATVGKEESQSDTAIPSAVEDFAAGHGPMKASRQL
jgi:hypothetical protein